MDLLDLERRLITLLHGWVFQYACLECSTEFTYFPVIAMLPSPKKGKGGNAVP